MEELSNYFGIHYEPNQCVNDESNRLIYNSSGGSGYEGSGGAGGTFCYTTTGKTIILYGSSVETVHQLFDKQVNIYSNYINQVENNRKRYKIKEIDYDEQDIKQKVISTIALIALVIILTM